MRKEIESYLESLRVRRYATATVQAHTLSLATSLNALCAYAGAWTTCALSRASTSATFQHRADAAVQSARRCMCA